ncbi:glycosyltransferase [Curtobacterium flaccumfaciens]|nr:glycosyltransferase [Curtobacterium flaccumfaciens]
MQPLKGLDLAIEAIADISLEARPTLVIAGDVSSEAGDYVDELRRLADACGIADHVTFIGPQSRADLAFLFRGAAAVLVPSHSETCRARRARGVRFRGAGRGGRRRGLREAVVDGETGVVLESRDPQDWANEIERILTDAPYAAGLAAAGREHAERLSWERSAAGLEDVYRRVLGRS